MKKFLAVALLSLSAVNANAGLVTNGGFESGLSGWSCTGADLCQADSAARHTGSAGAYGFDNSGFATLSQVLSTVVGATYSYSFFSSAYQVAGNQLSYSFSGLSQLVVPTTTAWASTAGTFIASTTSTTLSFFFATDPGTGTWKIDDVSVDQIASPVPEPETYAMLLAGFGLMAGIARRRKKQLAA
jgi:hypothetical protein